MFRILLIVVLIFYALYKLGLFRVFAGSAKDGYSDPNNIKRKPPGGNVNIDSAPDRGARKPNIKG
ncbi:MAG: hypothetical protein OEU76_05925, partial [Cyclobacteriaceae bacterium]|nr:hypothetical protein [Cyclobacteriaceae bacterium]